LGHILYAQPNPRWDERGISSLLLSMPLYATTHAGTNTGKSDGGKTCAKAFVHCGILKPVKA